VDPMVGLDKQFIEATDSLIALYRGIERRTLDLPSVSVMPFFIFFWSVLKFYFYFLVGIVLIIPVNFLIFVFCLGNGSIDHFSCTMFTMYGSGYGGAKPP
jgi:hypothetical protein